MDFKAPVKKLLKDMNPEYRLSKSAVDYMDVICEKINNNLVETYRDFDDLGKIKDAEKDVEYVVKQCLRGKLVKFAMSEGRKNTELYANGLLIYDPETELAPFKVIPTKQSKPTTERRYNPQLSFRSGVMAIAAQCNQAIHVQNGAKKSLSCVVYNLGKRLSQKAAEIANGKDRLEPKDIAEALPMYLLSDVLDHALQNGMKSLTLYGNGILAFKPMASAKRKAGGSPYRDSKRARNGGEGTVELKGSFYSTGLKRIAMNIANVHLDREGSKLLDIILQRITIELISGIDVDENASGLEVDHTIMSKALHQMFPDLLADHSEAEGTRAVARYAMGLFKYRRPPVVSQETKTQPEKIAVKKKETPKKETQKLKAKKGVAKKLTVKAKETKTAKKGGKKKETPKAETLIQPTVLREVKPDFTDGIIHLLDLYRERPSISKEAAVAINSVLQDVSKTIATECGLAATAEGLQEITPFHVMNVVHRVLPPELAQHATVEGEKTLAMRGLTMAVQPEVDLDRTAETVDEIPSDSSLIQPRQASLTGSTIPPRRPTHYSQLSQPRKSSIVGQLSHPRQSSVADDPSLRRSSETSQQSDDDDEQSISPRESQGQQHQSSHNPRQSSISNRAPLQRQSSMHPSYLRQPSDARSTYRTSHSKPMSQLRQSLASINKPRELSTVGGRYGPVQSEDWELVGGEEEEGQDMDNEEEDPLEEQVKAKDGENAKDTNQE